MKNDKFNLPLRPRRLRKNDAIRRLVRENHITMDDLIYPLFVRDGNNLKSEILISLSTIISCNTLVWKAAHGV